MSYIDALLRHMEPSRAKKQGALVACSESTKVWSLARREHGGKLYLRADVVTICLSVRTLPALPRYAEAIMASVRARLKLFCAVEMSSKLILEAADEAANEEALSRGEFPYINYAILPCSLSAQNLAEWLRPVFDRMFSHPGYYRLESVDIALMRGIGEGAEETGRA